MRNVGIAAAIAMTLCAGGALAQNISGSHAPLNKTHVFTQADFDKWYAELEARSPASCAEGPSNNFSPCQSSPGTPNITAGHALTLFTRVIRNSDPPRIMPEFELWFVQAGTATAVTGGKLINPKDEKGPGSTEVIGTAIEGGVEQAVKAGDVLYIPPYLPHTFKNEKGFRALLVRSEDVEGLVSQKEE